MDLLPQNVPHDPRDILWNDAYYLHYDTQYEEMLIATLLAIWAKVDALTKVLVAVTASGSAIAGWALWKDDGYRIVWAGIAGVGAVLAIFSSSLGVQSRLKEHSANQQKFSVLRTEVELLRHDMAINPQFDLTQMDEAFKSMKRRYTEHLNGEQHDILVCGWLERRVQNRLNSTFEKYA